MKIQGRGQESVRNMRDKGLTNVGLKGELSFTSSSGLHVCVKMFLSRNGLHLHAL